MLRCDHGGVLGLRRQPDAEIVGVENATLDLVSLLGREGIRSRPSVEEVDLQKGFACIVPWYLSCCSDCCSCRQFTDAARRSPLMTAWHLSSEMRTRPSRR